MHGDTSFLFPSKLVITFVILLYCLQDNIFMKVLAWYCVWDQLKKS